MATGNPKWINLKIWKLVQECIFPVLFSDYYYQVGGSSPEVTLELGFSQHCSKMLSFQQDRIEEKLLRIVYWLVHSIFQSCIRSVFSASNHNWHIIIIFKCDFLRYWGLHDVWICLLPNTAVLEALLNFRKIWQKKQMTDFWC